MGKFWGYPGPLNWKKIKLLWKSWQDINLQDVKLHLSSNEGISFIDQ